ncbi:hypothetical protein BD289DRAFT_241054 [Coniella lustricola]|uniref:Uncharacterized protein n=1 Tax=Coniella lustricola TaxID=2025994 RepID=A0A2T3A9I0_9PEZI|nr:hypothetical protein BD289DRAFT_241054 [Coniella lustricola]
MSRPWCQCSCRTLRASFSASFLRLVNSLCPLLKKGFESVSCLTSTWCCHVSKQSRVCRTAYPGSRVYGGELTAQVLSVVPLKRHLLVQCPYVRIFRGGRPWTTGAAGQWWALCPCCSSGSCRWQQTNRVSLWTCTCSLGGACAFHFNYIRGQPGQPICICADGIADVLAPFSFLPLASWLTRLQICFVCNWLAGAALPISRTYHVRVDCDQSDWHSLGQRKRGYVAH